MHRVGVIGASGYIGSELIRILALHPEIELECITSRRFAGKKVGDVIPWLNEVIDLKFENVSVAQLCRRCDFVFTSVPHGVAMDYVPKLMRRGMRVVDLSADYRLPRSIYESVYQRKHKGYMQAVYGLTELHPEVRDAKLVANPGCYPTGCVLAVAPLVSEMNVKSIIFDCKSGISGAGATPSEKSHFPNLSENVIPYEITSHRHIPEIVQEIGRYANPKIYFTPHIIPVVRGIFTTAHVILEEDADEGELRKIYARFYRGKKFVRIVDVPSLIAVRGSNFCDVGLRSSEGRVVAMSAIDNLMKGGAGQAVQNMNLMLGFEEDCGLKNVGGM